MKNILLFGGVLGLDLGSKAWVEKNLPLRQRKEIIKDFLFVQHIKNTGFAYHKFAGRQKMILAVTGILTAYYSFAFFKAGKKDSPTEKLALPLALTLGGAYGNLLERITKGSVTDFIFIKKGKNPPIFNVADVALLLGSLWIAVVSVTKLK